MSRTRPPAGKSQPRRYRQRNVPRRWRRLAPVPPGAKPTRAAAVWRSLREGFWSWRTWAGIALGAALLDYWVWAGVATGLSVLTHFAAARVRIPSRIVDTRFEVASPGFMATVVGVTGISLVPNNRVQILNNGDAFFPAMLADIKAARRSVTLETYLYWSSDIGRRFAEAFAERSRQRIAVKLLLDAVGSATVGDEILGVLEEGHSQVAWFHPIRWHTLDRFNFRTHRRTLVVDGRIAYTGGAGIADQWTGDAQDAEHWRDIHVRIEGPAALSFQTGFAQNWLKMTGELVSGPVFFPEPEPAGRVTVLNLLSSPQAGTSAARLLHELSLRSARRSILVSNSYFIPDHATIQTLVEARARGVDVKILVSGDWNDQWLARLNSVRLYGPLLAGGVEIYEYQRTMLHQKMMIVDDAWATIGTANFDNRSFALNEENNVCFFDSRLIAELREIFEADLEAARRIDLRMWRRRGWWARGQELVASVLQDQM